ncbi:MAG TPA: erythromycin esterase family protein [Bacteroidales bacterium]|jgi:erythromycin esterase-like protein|nr:erythromycin esterase family protein [Bacteroidales bacterium]
MRTYILFLPFVVLCAMSCTAQSEKQTYTELYDLHFAMPHGTTVRYPWLDNGAYSFYSLPASIKDSTNNLIARIYLKGSPFLNRLRTECGQRILLPDGNLQKAVVEFESKGKNIQQLSIVLDAIDEEEKILFSDTMKLVPDTLLGVASKNIALKDAKLLNIRINSEGKIDSDAYIAFSKLNIVIDGKPIDKFPVRELPPLTTGDLYYYTAINRDENISPEVMDEFNNHKIIGLGESIHGNRGVQGMAYKLILQAVERLDCQLVLLEMQLEKSLHYNRFIQDVNYTFDSFSALDETTSDFLKKLQRFNTDKSDEQKVRLYGIGYNTNINTSLTPSKSSAIDIFDFVTNLNQELKISAVDQFALLLAEEKQDQAIEFLDNQRNITEKAVTPEEVESILHILKISEEMGKDPIDRFVRRDSTMFLNAQYLIDRFANADNAKAIIYAHAAHTNPVSTFPAVPCFPLGHYMRETYGDGYSSFLLLTGSGKSVASDTEFNMRDSLLKEPPKKSIEYALNLMEDNALYLPLTADFNTLVLSRFKGSHHTPQEFYPFNLYQRYRGIFFIKDDKDYDAGKKESSYEEALDQQVIEMNKREEKIEEIRRRVSN